MWEGERRTEERKWNGETGKGKDPETTAAQADLSGGCDGDDVDHHPRHADIHMRLSVPVF